MGAVETNARRGCSQMKPMQADWQLVEGEEREE